MEPFINSTLSVAQKIPSRQFTAMTVGVVVHSQVGPIEPTVITSPRQFLNLYTVNNRISKGDHPSLHNAYFLSRSTDLVVTRATTVNEYDLVGLQSEETVDTLPSGNVIDRSQLIQLLTAEALTDEKSGFIQVGDTLFYGLGGVNPFEDGDTVTRINKGTDDANLTLLGLGTSSDWKTHELSVELFSSTDTIAEDVVVDEIISYFSSNGAGYNNNFKVTKQSSTSLKFMFSSSNPVNTNNFYPNLESDGSVTTDKDSYVCFDPTEVVTNLTAIEDPYLIGSKNLGSVDTVKAWITDVTAISGTTYSRWNLNIFDNLNGLITYKVSDNPDEVDVQGNPIYYTWISEIREDIIYIENPNGGTTTIANTTEPTQPNVGKSQAFIDEVANQSDLLAAAQFAATQFDEYETKRIQLYTDAGWYNKSVADQLESTAQAKKGLVCVSMSPEVKDVNQIKDYFAGFNSFYSICHVNAGKDTSIVGFQIPISASCYYIESAARNSTRNSTYAPVFSKVNGPVSEGKLYHTFTKSQRDELNNANINVLVYDDTDGVAYINNNFISDTSGSLIDEEQNIRIVNEIQYDIEKLMESFYSRYNIAGTRAAVETSIDNYFKTVILGQSYTISGYKVECSEVNNTIAMIQNNELKVDVFIQLNHSIKYITVATNVVPTL
jgi:hypothetical protein